MKQRFHFGNNKLATRLIACVVLVFGLFQAINHQQMIADWVSARVRGGVQAALTGVTLNNSNGNVVTGFDVTSQTTALDPDIGAYRWTVNGGNYVVLSVPFDSNSPISDFSGNGLTGTISGGATYNSTCKVGGCLTFDGVDDQVSFGDVAATEGVSSLSFGAWIKPTEYTQTTSNLDLRSILTKGSMNGDNTSTFTSFFQGNNTTGYNFVCSVDTTTDFPGLFADAETYFPLNTWTHYMCTWTSGGPIRLYVNGTEVVTTGNVGGVTVNTAFPLYIGFSSNGTDDKFKGDIDEAMVFARNVSASQVIQLYSDGNTGVGGPTIIQSEETSVGQVWDLSITPITTAGSIGSVMESSNPVVIVSGTPTITGTLDTPDEGSPIISALTIPGGSTAGYRWVVNNVNFATFVLPFNSLASQIDISGTQNHGTPQNGAVFTTSGCKVGGCLSLDGANDHVTITDAASLNLTGSQTFSAWIKPSAHNAQKVVYARWGPTDHQTLMDIVNGVVRYSIRTPAAASVTRTGSVTTTVGNWYHVAGVYNATATTLDVYVNGVLANASLSGVVTSSLRSPTVGVPTPMIGYKGDGAGTESFAGLIDEAQLVPRALSAAQIYQLYQDGLAGIGGPTRISAQEHASGQTWDLVATEFLSDGSVGPAGYIDSTTITAASSTTLGITTPGTTQSGNITVNYSCSNTNSLLRDILVEYSTNSGGSFANATLVSTSSGSVAGNLLSMVDCASGTSNNSFVWNSVANGVGDTSNVQIRITAQHPGGASAVTTDFVVDNPTNLCTAGGEATGGLTAAETSFDGTAVAIYNCTYTIDGAHSFSSFTVGDGVGSSDSIVKHSATTTTTIFSLNITSTSDITINSDGIVDANGLGYLGANRGGNTGTAIGRTTGNTTTGGSTNLVGGSHGGLGGRPSGTVAVTYDSITNPVEPGGGGGSRDSANTGQTGGGIIHLTTTGAITVSGVIRANGEQLAGVNAGGGAGGSVKLTAGGLLSGAGAITAIGSNAVGVSGDSPGGGGGGRIAVYYGSSTYTGTMSAYGGLLANAGVNASAGTVYTKAAAQANGDLIVDNNNIVAIISGTTLPATPTDYDNVTVRNRGRAMITQLQANVTPWTIGTLSVESNSDITSAESNLTNVYKLNFSVTNLTIDGTSTITTDGRGYYTAGPNKNAGSSSGRTAGNVTGSASQVGGSHGGLGGTPGGAVAATYDSVTAPSDAGGGGGSRDTSNNGRDGGGIIRIIATGTMTINGVLSADGEQTGGSNGGGGAGGAMYITVGTLAGSGSIRANGSNAVGVSGDSPGGGGGGRVAVHYTTNSFAGTITAYGGLLVNSGVNANAGTVYMKSDAQTYGDLIVDNNNVSAVISGTTLPNTPNTYDNVTIRNRGRARITQLQADATPWTIGTLALSTNSDITSEETTTTNIYKLYLDVTTLTIDATSSIQTDGRGYLGANKGGNTGTATGRTNGNTTTGGSANWVGGSHGGRGGLGGSTGANVAVTYDSITEPTEPGGGSGSRDTSNSGRDGGGIIRIITSGTMTVDGTISSDGEQSGGSNGGGGAGGTVHITTGVLAGSGSIRANGSNGVNVSGDVTGGGGGGRLALYYTTNSFTGTIIAAGGARTLTGADGGSGTVYLKHPSQSNGDLIVDNNNRAPALGSTTLPTSPRIFDNTTLRKGARIRLTALTSDSTPWSFGTFIMETGSDITSEETTLSSLYRVYVTASTATIDATSGFNVDGRGFLGANQTSFSSNVGRTTGNTTTNGSNGSDGGGSGGSHGGRGATGPSAVSGIAYDSLTAPVEPGGGGGARDNPNFGGDGGGIIRFDVVGTLTLNGLISSKGITPPSGVGGGGAGGSIYLNVGSFVGNGTISVRGGDGYPGFGAGGGAGGRIAIYYDQSTFTGTYETRGGTSNSANHGASGTVFLKDNAVAVGTLRVNNASIASNVFTPLFVISQPTTYTFQDVYVINSGRLLIDTPCAGTPALTVTGLTDLSGGGTITNNQSGTCTVTQSAISVTTTTLPAAEVNQVYSQQVVSTGGYGPHTFVCRNGGITVACTTVLPAGLDMSSAGVVSGTPTVTGTTVFTVRATEASPGLGTDEETISITVGNAPSAPTNLFANSIDAQSCCSTPTTDTTPVFSAVFNDADAGNTAGKYRIQVASDAGFTTLLWNSDASGIALGGSCAVSARCANITYAGSALSAGGVTYYWRIKYWDNNDLEGPFSATSTFITSIAPTAPTTLFSNDSSAQSGLTNPIGILATNPVLSAIFNDPDIGDTASKYRVQVSTTNNFSGIIWDSGSGGTNMASCNEGTRCDDIVFGGTALERNEATYYWRIKFWDAAGVEGAWSQDPTSTNTFTMGILGSSTPSSTPPPQPTVPDAPIAGAVEVLGPNSVRYNWVDVSNNETGFRVLNAENQVIADVPAGTTSAVESSLPANSLVEGRKVLAYNSLGQSTSASFASVRTAAPIVQPFVQQRGGDSVTFIIEPAFTVQSGQTSAFPGQTAVRFDVIVTDTQGITRTMSSDWIQSNTYTFSGIAPEDAVQVRVVTRNEGGLQNEPSLYEDIGSLSRRFVVNMGVFKKGTETLPRPMIATDVISVRMTMTSVGTDAANSVTLNMPLPRYVVYVPGSLIVDGRSGSDTPGDQGTLANRNGVSASWATVHPGESHTIAFELVFDIEDLRSLRDTTVVGTPDEVLAALVQATANPLIHLQASVSFADSDAVYMSPVITLEPDVETTDEPLIEETPIDELPVVEEPVVLPTPEETQIIEQILQQEFPSPTPTPQPGDPTPTPSPAPTLQTGETTSNNDAGSFNLNVTGEDSKLGLTGNASVQADQIQFTGTTTEPFTVITLIFNDSITAIAVSDANGFWQTFVDADRLGILPGQQATVKIEAIAAKGDLRSERVSVGDVVVSRGRSGDIAAEFDTTVSDSPIISVLEEIEHQVVKVVEEQEPVIKTTLTVSAPVVIVSSAPLWGYLPYAPTLIYHFISWMLGLVGRKRKDSDVATYGVVYDAITKLPLALAIVRVYNQADNKLASTIVTDKLGRYDVLLAPGQYRLEVSKPQYQYPSGIVTSAIDGTFDRIYNKQSGFTVTEKGPVLPHVPVDPVNAQRQWQLSFGFKKLWLAFQRAGNLLATPIILIGLFMSLALLYAVPDKPSNWIIAGLYALTLAIQFKLKPKLIKAWGVVYDVASNAILPLVTIQLIEPATSKVVTSRLSDYEGRFTFLPEPGSYVVKASKPGFSQVTEVVQSPYPDRQPLPQTIDIKKPSERVSGDVPMKQGA